MNVSFEKQICPVCNNSLDPKWNVCPSCGTKILKIHTCSTCQKELENRWKTCPYCGTAITETIGSSSISIKDSVVKDLHQIHNTDTHETKGANIGGNINIAVSTDHNSRCFAIDKTEPSYYSDENGIRITPTRLIIPGKSHNEGPSTYAMANITSVKMEKHNPKRFGGIIIALIGAISIAIAVISHTEAIIGGGGIFIILGIIWAVLLKPKYHLKVSSASGETDAFISKDKQYINRVVIAINEALIKRG